MWLEAKYINLLAGTLTNLTRRGSGVWNYRCPFCGDSKKSKSKARGYLIQDKNSVYSICHNCGESHSFPNFLKIVSPYLYEQYIYETYQDRRDIVVAREEPIKQLPPEEILKLPRISLLDTDHPARKYLADRLIPDRWLSELYYADDFYAFCRNFFTEKYQSNYKEKRIVIPLIDQHNKLIGFQGRAIAKTDLRYITALFSSSNSKLYNLNNINFNKTNYCFEGAFDAMFIENSFAVLGVSADSQLRKNRLPTNRTVIVYDNEPRNKDVCRMINKAIDLGYQVVIWPKYIKEKDINSMILMKGISVDRATDYIRRILQENTYRELEAELFFNDWKN